MTGKRFIANLCAILGIAFLCTGCFSKKEAPVVKVEENKPAVEKTAPKQVVQTPKPIVKKYDLYSSTPYDLPLFSIVEISKLPDSVKKSVDKVLESSQGFYFLKAEKDKVLIILQNPVSHSDTYNRHELQFAEVDPDGRVTYHMAGYAGIDGETSNAVNQKEDVWEFDETLEPKRPLKHTAYDENGKVKFTEIWNYDSEEAVKYQMKDSNEKIVSIMKESQDNDSNFRKEHVFYDNDGKTTMSLSVNYDGANISRMTYFNSHDSIDSVSIMSEYTDGVKTKELVYNEDYVLLNTVTSDYADGERKDIKLLDSEGKEVEKISS